MSDPKTYNELVYKISERVKELGNQTMESLRLTNGYGCDNDFQCHQKDKGKKRGDIIEEIIHEEFIIEFDRDIEQ